MAEAREHSALTVTQRYQEVLLDVQGTKFSAPSVVMMCATGAAGIDNFLVEELRDEWPANDGKAKLGAVVVGDANLARLEHLVDARAVMEPTYPFDALPGQDTMREVQNAIDSMEVMRQRCKRHNLALSSWPVISLISRKLGSLFRSTS